MLAQFQTQLRFSDEIIQAATETGCLRKAFFFWRCLHARNDCPSTEKGSISNKLKMRNSYVLDSRVPNQVI